MKCRAELDFLNTLCKYCTNQLERSKMLKDHDAWLRTYQTWTWHSSPKVSVTKIEKALQESLGTRHRYGSGVEHRLG